MKAGLRTSVFSLRSLSRGFTLIELLVVIAIMGILALIIVPVLGRVQERGREAQCASNLRQLHLAAFNYADANRGNFPRAYAVAIEDIEDELRGALQGWVASVAAGGDPDPRGHAWWYEKNRATTKDGTKSVLQGRLFPYLGDAGDQSVYICPSMARLARRTPGLTDEKRHVVRSYGMNPSLGRINAVNLIGASRTFLFADQGFTDMGGGRRFLTQGDDGHNSVDEPEEDDDEGTRYFNRYNTTVDGSIDYNHPTNSVKEWIGGYHGSQANVKGAGRGNAVFVDGHVESVMYEHTDFIGRGNWERGKPIP